MLRPNMQEAFLGRKKIIAWQLVKGEVNHDKKLMKIYVTESLSFLIVDIN